VTRRGWRKEDREDCCTAIYWRISYFEKGGERACKESVEKKGDR